MLFYLVIFLSIFIPFAAPRNSKNSALLISALLLFIPWGFQYEVTQDWEPHLAHWNVANNGASQVLLQREAEPLYRFILNICSPLGFFGFLILSAVTHLSVIFYLIKKNVPANYYWAAVAVLILTTENGLLMINSNRQSWALITTIIGTIILFGRDNIIPVFNKIIRDRINMIIGFLLYLSAFLFHGGAIAALGLIPIYFASYRIKRLNGFYVIIAFNVLFAFRYVLDASSFQTLANLYYASTGLDNFEKYIEDIEVEEHLSTVYGILYFIFMNLVLITYHKMSQLLKFASLAVLFKIIMSAFLTGTIQRILQYYQIYDIILVPCIFSIIKMYKTQYRIVFATRYLISFAVLSLIIYDFMKNIYTSYCYDRWPEFQTIFEAPQWM